MAGAASEVFAPSQNIFAAVMYLVNSARDVSACYDNIEELFEKLKDFTARLSFYVSQRMSKELHEKVVNILVTLFQILILATAEIRQGRAMSYIKRLLGKESPVNEPMKRLAHLTESEGRLVGAETLAVVKQSLSNEERLIQMMSRVDINGQYSPEIRIHTSAHPSQCKLCGPRHERLPSPQIETNSKAF